MLLLYKNSLLRNIPTPINQKVGYVGKLDRSMHGGFGLNLSWNNYARMTRLDTHVTMLSTQPDQNYTTHNQV